MRIVLAAVAALVFNIYFLLTFENLSPGALLAAPSSLNTAKDFLLLLFFFYILIDALIQFIQRRRLSDSPKKSAASESQISSGTAAALQEALDTEKTERRLLEGKLKESELSAKSLQVAICDLENRLSRAEHEVSLKQRPQAVDAEIVHLLGVFQEKGRLIDFLMEDVAPYSDAQVGAAARVVHQGASTVLKEYFTLKPIHSGAEGDAFVLNAGYAASHYRLLGKVGSEPPFKGRVLHRGWQVDVVRLPRVSGALGNEGKELIIAPAEIEVS
jgi:hypothetical protein